MKPTALICSEPIRASMGGIGIRYLEFARRLSERGLDLVLFTPGEAENVPEVPFSRTRIRSYQPGTLAAQVGGCGCIVTQGQAASELVAAGIPQPLVIDFYDPYLIENLYYSPEIGSGQYHQDLEAWRNQLGRGDLFLCASEAQRLYYLGFLTALGRVEPHRMNQDPDLRSLIDVVPYGTEVPYGEFQTILPVRKSGEKRILFGGMYDWYDPWPLLHCLEEETSPTWTLIFMRNPNPDMTPQRIMREIIAWAEKQSPATVRIEFHDWVPAERRFDLLQDVDVMVVPHAQGLETRLSLRTRVIDALAAGCPVVASCGGTLSDLLEEYNAGWVVPAGKGRALFDAVKEVVQGGDHVEDRKEKGRDLVREIFGWGAVLEPLLCFCRNPVRDDPVPQPAWSPYKIGLLKKSTQRIFNRLPRLPWM